MHMQGEHLAGPEEGEYIKLSSINCKRVDAQQLAQETGLPHGVLVGGGQAWVGGWRAAGRSHDAISQQEVSEE